MSGLHTISKLKVAQRKSIQVYVSLNAIVRASWRGPCVPSPSVVMFRLDSHCG